MAECVLFTTLFKLFLLPILQTLNRNTKLTDDTGKKELPAQTVFSHGIKYLKDHLLKHLESSHTGLHEGDIHWCLTVPAIWNDSAKQFMRESAAKVTSFGNPV